MKKKFPFIIIAVLLVIVSVMAFALIKQSQEENVKNNGVVYEPNAVDGSVMYAGSNLPGVAIPGWTAIKLPAGTLEADVSLHNPDSNDGYYNLSFTLKLADTGEEIFTTGPIEPGYKCSKVLLNAELNTGKYHAVMFVQPYLQNEAQTPVNNAEMEILLIVE